MKKLLTISAAFILGFIGIAVVWWLFSPLYINQPVEESLPFEIPSESKLADLSPEEAEEMLNEAMADIDEEFVAKIATISTMMPDQPIHVVFSRAPFGKQKVSP